MSLPQEPETPRPLSPMLMPWENGALSLFARIWGTLGNALAPVRGVPALCSGPVLPALGFALLTALPSMLLWGIIPFTHTLQFGPSAQVVPTAEAGSVPLWLDLSRAVGLGFGISFVSLLSWSLPFVSLLRAFGHAQLPPAIMRTIGLRFVLYRAWLAPAGQLAFGVVVWLAPTALSSALVLPAFILFRFAPVILVLIGAQATATALGASVLGAIAVALVPSIMEQVVGLTVAHFAGQFVPTLPTP